MRPVFVVFALALAAAGCGGNSTVTPIVPPAVVTTETFTGTVAVGVGNFDSHNFTVSQQGALSVTLTAAGPPATIFMGLAVGTPSGSTCTPLTGAATTAQAGTTPQLSGTAAAGTYCVVVVDLGNLTAPVDYSVTVSHT